MAGSNGLRRKRDIAVESGGVRKSFAGLVALRDARSKFEASAMANRRDFSFSFRRPNASRETKSTREARQQLRIRADREVDPVTSLPGGTHRKSCCGNRFRAVRACCCFDELIGASERRIAFSSKGPYLRTEGVRILHEHNNVGE